jgi:RES domain-containing protein
VTLTKSVGAWIASLRCKLGRRAPDAVIPRRMTPEQSQMTQEIRLDLHFPQFTLGRSFGQWWRIHGAANGPWWFSSADAPGRDPATAGRFDLALPNGTLYLGNYLDASAAEALREPGVSAKAAQEAANSRRLSAMPLEAFHGKVIADFTSAVVDRFGAPVDIAMLERAQARPWAAAAHEAGFAGVLYRLKEDPKRRLGLALFGEAGALPEPDRQAFPQPLPVGLRNELLDLFDGEYRGDPLPK